MKNILNIKIGYCQKMAFIAQNFTSCTQIQTQLLDAGSSPVR